MSIGVGNLGVKTTKNNEVGDNNRLSVPDSFGNALKIANQANRDSTGSRRGSIFK